MHSEQLPRKDIRTIRKFRNGKNISGVQINSIDKYLHRLANFSQFALLILGVFGYFYTVLPIFQNQLLQENLAKLEIEKSKSEEKLASLIKQQKKVENEINTLQVERDKEQVRNARLEADNDFARKSELKSRLQFIESEKKLRINLTDLDKVYWNLLYLKVSSNYFKEEVSFLVKSYDEDLKAQFAYLRDRENSSKDDIVKRRENVGNFILLSGKNWPNPYDELMKALNLSHVGLGGQNDIPEKYYLGFKEMIESKKTLFKCDKPDLEELHKEYMAEMVNLEPVIDAALNGFIEGVRKEYEDKHEQVLLADDYKYSSRQAISLDKIYGIERAYRYRLSNIRYACKSKGNDVLQEIGKKIKKEK